LIFVSETSNKAARIWISIAYSILKHESWLNNCVASFQNAKTPILLTAVFLKLQKRLNCRNINSP
jgi:hypothetical protein